MKKPEYRVRFVTDPDSQFEECNGEDRPLTEEEYAENSYMKDGEPIPYSDYLEYYGNPERHVYLMCEVQKRCQCCGTWSYAGGTGSIDVMDDDPELTHADQWMTPDMAEAMPGYLREVALEDLQEAGYRLPKRVYCKRKGCKYHHVSRQYTVASQQQDVRFCAQHQPGRQRLGTSNKRNRKDRREL